jgi:hypothetical protein
LREVRLAGMRKQCAVAANAPARADSSGDLS